MARFGRFLLVALIAAVVGACGALPGATRPAAAAGLSLEVTVAEAARLRDAGDFVLDVREPSEWAAGHIPGATLIPLAELRGRIDDLPRDETILVVCRSGNRSAQGRDILLAAGFRSVTSLAGGMNDWAAAGYEVVSGD